MPGRVAARPTGPELRLLGGIGRDPLDPLADFGGGFGRVDDRQRQASHRHVIRIPFKLLLSERPRSAGGRRCAVSGSLATGARPCRPIRHAWRRECRPRPPGVPAVASRSTVSSASNSHSARSSPLTPGHSALGLTLSSIWAWTSIAVSLSRRVRMRSRRWRRSSGSPIRTVSAVVSTTIAIRARSARMFSRRTLSGRSGMMKALQTKLQSVPTSVAPISHGSSENFARR